MWNAARVKTYMSCNRLAASFPPTRILERSLATLILQYTYLNRDNPFHRIYTYSVRPDFIFSTFSTLSVGSRMNLHSVNDTVPGSGIITVKITSGNTLLRGIALHYAAFLRGIHYFGERSRNYTNIPIKSRNVIRIGTSSYVLPPVRTTLKSRQIDRCA